MCTRFTTLRVNVTGSPNDVGFEAAGHSNGLMPGGMPQGTTTAVGRWHLAESAMELVDATVGDRTEEPRLSVLTLGLDSRERVIQK